MTPRELTKLRESLLQQGCTLVDTKNGWIVRFADGVNTYAFHRRHKTSDHRGEKNFLAALRRNGITI